MDCVVIKADKRFKEYDLDVIAVANYEETLDGRTLRLDTTPCSKSLSYKDIKSKYPFIIIPATISDIFPDIIILGEVHAEREVVNDWWVYRVDRGMLEMVLKDYFVRLKYIEMLKRKDKLTQMIKRK